MLGTVLDAGHTALYQVASLHSWSLYAKWQGVPETKLKDSASLEKFAKCAINGVNICHEQRSYTLTIQWENKKKIEIVNKKRSNFKWPINM